MLKSSESSTPLLEPSLPEAFRSVEIPEDGSTWLKKLASYAGPGAMVASGYMDPGNWGTDLAAGSTFGYRLLFVVLLASFIAVFLQRLAVKAGIAFGRDLAQICKDNYSRRYSTFLWVVMEIAIAATEVAEVIGGAIAFKLLFGIPVVAGILLTAADVLIILFMRGSHIRTIEGIMFALVTVIGVCLIIELAYSQPNMEEVLLGYLPHSAMITNSEMLYVTISVIGATVMPHNLFLHSSLVLTRANRPDEKGKVEAVKFACYDTYVSLFYAFLVNSAIVVVAAAAFHINGYDDVATLEDAYQLLDPVLGGKVASVLFGIALLASGQSATFTGNVVSSASTTSMNFFEI